MPPSDESRCKFSAVDQAQAGHSSAGQWVSRKPSAFVLVASAYVLGGGGMLAWLVFLLKGPWSLAAFNLGAAGGLLLDTLLCLLFFVQHSLMVRRRFRLWLTRWVRAELQGTLYATASGICLLILVGLWQPVGTPLWDPGRLIRWSMLALFLAAGAGAWWGAQSLDGFDALGVKPALRTLGGHPSTPPPEFIVRGPYRWVRHPLYLFSLIVIWSCPVFTPDRLWHNALWTAWVVIGARMEERDLIDCFGEAYRFYRKSVPMLMPTSLKPLVPPSGRVSPNASR